MSGCVKINSVAHVCDVFLPGVERPINQNFDYAGETFYICTYEFMRGPFDLQGDETPRGYFITSLSPWLDLHIDVYPERGTYRKRIGLKKSAKKDIQAQDKFDRLAPTIEAAFINAITGEKR